MERGVRLLNENAEGTYKTKHAEAARLNYTTTTHRHTHTQTLSKDRQNSPEDRTRRLRHLGRGGDPVAKSGDQGRSNARGAERRAPGIILVVILLPVIVLIAGGNKRRELVGPGAIRGR